VASYKVVHGDTLSAIAARHHMSLKQLEHLNPGIKNPNRISIGQSVNVSAAAGHPAKAKPKPPAKKPAPLTPYQQLLNKLQGVPGSQRDAYAALSTLFKGYGLQTLAPKILDFLQQGFGSDTITTLLQETPEYTKRFAGNQARIKNGLEVLTPAEYLSTEASYKQILQTAGLDPAWMDQKHYAEWISRDIAPTEIQDRVNLATQATLNAPTQLVTALGQMGIAHGDLVSYFLNDRNPMPQLQQKMAAAQIKEAGMQSGLQVTNNTAIDVAQRGVTHDQAAAAYQKIADILPEAGKLSQIYKGQKGYNQTSGEQEFLTNNGGAQLARESLSQAEEATFSGQGGTGQKSFANQTAGTGF